MKLRAYSNETGALAGFHHWCPACDQPHGIAVTMKNRVGALWNFNGDYQKPTFTPSVRCFVTDENGRQQTTCHYFITEGMIRFCGDNPHALNNQIVPLPEWPHHDD